MVVSNKTGKVAPEHRRLHRYHTMHPGDICALPVADLCAPTAHCYLWCPNALLPDGIAVMKSWGFTYKTVITWYKIRKDGGPDGRGVGFYFRNVTELVLFGVRGRNARTLAPGRRQVNLLAAQARALAQARRAIRIIEACRLVLISSCSPRHARRMDVRGEMKSGHRGTTPR